MHFAHIYIHKEDNLRIIDIPFAKEREKSCFWIKKKKKKEVKERVECKCFIEACGGLRIIYIFFLIPMYHSSSNFSFFTSIENALIVTIVDR